MTGLSIAFGIVLPSVLSYAFVASLVFRVLEKLHIGFDEYWYPRAGMFKGIYNDHDSIWCIGAALLSIFWPVAMPPLIIFKAMHKASKSVFELIESHIEDEGADDQGRD